MDRGLFSFLAQMWHGAGGSLKGVVMTVSFNDSTSWKRTYLKTVFVRSIVGIAAFAAFCVFCREIATEDIPIWLYIILMYVGTFYGLLFQHPDSNAVMLYVYGLAIIVWWLPIFPLWILAPMALVAFTNGVLFPYRLPPLKKEESVA